MTKTQAISYFGSAAACAKALGVSESAVAQWPDKIPALRQYQIAHASSGALAVDADYLPTKSDPGGATREVGVDASRQPSSARRTDLRPDVFGTPEPADTQSAA